MTGVEIVVGDVFSCDHTRAKAHTIFEVVILLNMFRHGKA